MLQHAPVEDEETFKIVGSALTVQRAMGGGLFERTYNKARQIEFIASGVPFVVEPPIELSYRGQSIGVYRPDFVCYGSIIVEVKAAAGLLPQFYAQTMHYLMSYGASRALLLNFGVERLTWKRFVHPKPEDDRKKRCKGTI